MSYLVLARKYRPKTFGEVAGQEVAMRVLQGAIAEDRVGHAYLLCGPRGTGKTTTARILAKALNCERGPTPEPCGGCERCRSIDAGNDVDVIEIDAASNNGVEDVRDLRERVAYAPMRARFKIYIVDEVHMLSKPANNALLKTLEEPPAHVKFLFATTEPQRLLDTVRSRCQIVQLALIDEERIAARLAEILRAEGLEPAAGVTAELARHARGSMRDALSLTDQLLALTSGAPSLEDVRRIAGRGGPELADRLLSFVEQGDRPGLIAALAEAGGDELELATSLLEHVRGCLLSALCPGEAALFESEPSERERRAARVGRVPPDRLQVWLEELLHARERMAALESHARVVLEVTLLDLCRPGTDLPLEELERRLLDLERRLADGAAPGAAPAAARPRPAATPTPAPRAAPPAGPPARQPVAGAAPARPASPPEPGAPRPSARGGASPAPGAAPDPFTTKVADLFAGRVEEA